MKTDNEIFKGVFSWTLPKDKGGTLASCNLVLTIDSDGMAVATTDAMNLDGEGLSSLATVIGREFYIDPEKFALVAGNTPTTYIFSYAAGVFVDPKAQTGEKPYSPFDRRNLLQEGGGSAVNYFLLSQVLESVIELIRRRGWPRLLLIDLDEKGLKYLSINPLNQHLIYVIQKTGQMLRRDLTVNEIGFIAERVDALDVRF